MSTADQANAAEQLASRLEFETLIADTSAALLAAPAAELEHAVQHCLEHVRAFFRADRCALLSVSADQQVVAVRAAAYSPGTAPVPPELDLSSVFPWSRHRLLVERAPIRVSRIDELPADATIERESWAQLPIRSALSLPIEAGGRVSYLIILNTVHDERDWPLAFVTRLRVLGGLLAGALERQRMLAGLRETEARLSSAAELAGLGFYEVDFAAEIAYVDERFRELCGLPVGSNQGLRALEHWIEHLHPDDRPRVLHVRQQLHEGTLAQANVEYRLVHPQRGPIWIQHLGRIAARDASGRALRAYGVLRDITPRKQVEDELLGLSQRLIRAHEEERALLARELHDDLTQRLAVLAIDAGRAELAAAPGAQRDALQAVREGLTRLSEDVHSLAYHLHPSVLAELGLAEALRAECERRGRHGGIEFATDLDALHDVVAEGAALCLFRVAQEALNNVVRHAAARTALVTLRRMGGGLLLAVRDDGVGFEPTRAGHRQSLGLASMRERVRLVNGTLDIESAPGLGTNVVAWVPTDERGTS